MVASGLVILLLRFSDGRDARGSERNARAFARENSVPSKLCVVHFIATENLRVISHTVSSREQDGWTRECRPQAGTANAFLSVKDPRLGVCLSQEMPGAPAVWQAGSPLNRNVVYMPTFRRRRLRGEGKRRAAWELIKRTRKGSSQQVTSPQKTAVSSTGFHFRRSKSSGRRRNSSKENRVPRPATPDLLALVIASPRHSVV